MFSLIIVLISILLVALLAAAVIYYGGDSFNKGNAKAKAAEILNQAELIKGAFTAYKIEQGTIEINQAVCDTTNAGGDISGCLNPLIEKEYLNGIPQGAEGWYIDNDKTLRRTLGSDAKACAIANFVNGAFPQNPEVYDINALSTSNNPSDVTLFNTMVPSCAALTGADSYICCQDKLE
jgi:type II secretory pathway pseudopilin PulG